MSRMMVSSDIVQFPYGLADLGPGLEQFVQAVARAEQEFHPRILRLASDLRRHFNLQDHRPAFHGEVGRLHPGESLRVPVKALVLRQPGRRRGEFKLWDEPAWLRVTYSRPVLDDGRGPLARRTMPQDSSLSAGRHGERCPESPYDANIFLNRSSLVNSP